MKRIYSRPLIVERELQVISLFALSVLDEDADPSNPTLGTKRRGAWGDLWNDDENE